MDGHPYEYKALVEYISPEETGRFPHFSRIEDQEGLTTTINEVLGHLPESIPPEWEVISHDLTVSRNTVIFTVLMRRPAQAGEAFNY